MTFDPGNPWAWLGGPLFFLSGLYLILYGGWKGIIRKQIPIGNPPLGGARAVGIGAVSTLLGGFLIWLAYVWLIQAWPHL